MAKESNKLDAKTVKNLTADPEQDKKYSDGGGLYLLVKKNGSKYWRMNYRHPISKKQNTLALGTFAKYWVKRPPIPVRIIPVIPIRTIAMQSK